MEIVNLIIINNKVFAGRVKPEGGLTDIVEFTPVIDNRGQMMIIGVLIGDMLNTPENSIIFELNIKSAYYQNYIKTVSNIEIVKGNMLH